MTSLVTAPEPPLGSYENPHPFERGQDRVIGEYYFKNDWNNPKKWVQYNTKAGVKKKFYDPQAAKKYHNDNKERDRRRMLVWRKNNPNKSKETSRKWRENNPDRVKENREKYKEVRNKKLRIRYKTDINYKLSQILRSRLYKGLKGIVNKNKSSIEYTCCSTKFLKKYLEIQFLPGMTWDNYGHGKGKWNVDHNKCMEQFDLNNEEEKFMCQHWTNLQPMWHNENCYDKRNKFDPATFRYKWWGKEIGWLGIPKYLMPNTSKLL